jgi:hypothetical protein
MNLRWGQMLTQLRALLYLDNGTLSMSAVLLVLLLIVIGNWLFGVLRGVFLAYAYALFGGIL